MIKVTHNCGFFSCCSVKLHYIVDYFNREKKIPDGVDSSEQFLIYKPLHMLDTDITYHFFKEPTIKSIEYKDKIDFDWNATLRPHTLLNLNDLKPFIDNYFKPSDEITGISEVLKRKYNLNFENTCAVYYRGTDQYKEVQYQEMNRFIEKMRSFKDVTFLVQTDDIRFIDLIKENFSSNILIIEENYVSSTNKGVHNEFNGTVNYFMIKFFYATLLLIAKCKYVICSSISNSSLWIVLYRNSTENIYY